MIGVTHSALEQIRKLCQDYQLIQLIWEGSSGVVVKGFKNHKPNRLVVLKCINKDILLNQEKDPELRALKNRLHLTEVTLMMNCDNPNILKCLDLLENEKYRVVVLEYCDGGSLYDLIKRESKLPEEKAIGILAQILFGFATLHQEKIVHRDFKAENVLISKGVYKIANFSKATKVRSLLESDKVTIRGSQITMAPEAVLSKEPGVQADLWSLGVVYFQMLFGVLPFHQQISQQQVRRMWGFVDKQSCSQESKELIKRMLVIDPQKRLRWAQLYKMYNKREGIFSKHFLSPQESRAVQSDEEEQLFYNCSPHKGQQPNQKTEEEANCKNHIQGPHTLKKLKENPESEEGSSKVLHQINPKQRKLSEQLCFRRIRAQLLHNIILKFTVPGFQQLKPKIKQKIYRFFLMVNREARLILRQREKFVTMSEDVMATLYWDDMDEILKYQRVANELLRTKVSLEQLYNQVLQELEQVHQKPEHSKPSRKNKYKMIGGKGQNSLFAERYIFADPESHTQQAKKLYQRIRQYLKKQGIQWNEEVMRSHILRFRTIIDVWTPKNVEQIYEWASDILPQASYSPLIR